MTTDHTGEATAPRLLCFHKQSTSARTRFLCHGTSVLAFAPLPDNSSLMSSPGKVKPHPSAHVQTLASHLGISTAHLRAETDFYIDVTTPDGRVPVLLIEVTLQDPPFSKAEAIGARFIALTEARALPSIELELLRKAYEHILG